MGRAEERNKSSKMAAELIRQVMCQLCFERVEITELHRVDKVDGEFIYEDVCQPCWLAEHLAQDHRLVDSKTER